MKLVVHETYEGMYWLEWPDGVRSVDFYNLTWAKEHRATIQSRMPLRATEKLTGAFK